MSKNIEIGSFDFDTSKIEHKIAANNLEMQKFASTIKATKEEIKKQSKNISELENKIESERKAQQRLRTEFEKGHRSQESYNLEINKSNQKLDELVTEQIKLGKIQADALIIQNKTQQSVKDLRLENNELNKLMSAGRTELSENESAYQKLNKELNALKTEAKNLGAQMVVLEQDGKKGTDEYKKLSVQFIETSNKADELNNKFKSIDKSIGDNQRSVGDYKNAITSAFSEMTQGISKIASGDAIGGLGMIKNSLKGISIAAKETAIALLSNPITAILTGISAAAVGVGLALKEMFSYNKKAGEDIKFLEDKFGDLGKETEKLRTHIIGVSETFGIDFKRIADTVDSISSAGLSNEVDAIDAIAKGLATAPNADEFLSKLDLAASKARQTGINLDQVLNLTKALQGTAIDPNTIYGEFEKATNALYRPLSENKALVETFGKDFTESVLNNVKDGAINTIEALSLINKKGKDLNISSEQQAKLGKDLFGKMGANAKAYAENMRLVGESQKDQFKNTTALQQKTEELEKANTRLAIAKSEALKSDLLIVLGKNMEIIWVKAKILWYGLVEAITKAIKWFNSVTGASDILSETWDVLFTYAKSLWNLLKTLVNTLGDIFTALGLSNGETKSFIKSLFKALNPINIVKKAFSLLTSAVKEFSKFIEQNRINISAFAITAKNVFKQVFDVAKSFSKLNFSEGLEKLKDISISKEFAKAKKEVEKLAYEKRANTLKQAKLEEEKRLKIEEELKKRREEILKQEEARKQAEALATQKEIAKKQAEIKKQADAKKVAEAKKAAESAKKELEAEAKRSLEITKETSQQAIDIAKNELAQYIAINSEKIKDEKRLNSEKVRLQKEYYKEVQRQQENINLAERQSKIFAIQQKIDEINAKKKLSSNDLNERKNLEASIEILKKEYAIKHIELENQTNEKILAIDKKYDEQIIEQRKMSQAVAYQQQLLALEENGNNEYAIRRLQLERETQQKLSEFLKQNELLKKQDEGLYISQQEVNNARDDLQLELNTAKDEEERNRIQTQLDSLNLIEETSAEKSKQIAKDVDDFKLQSRAQVISGLANLFGKESALGKIFAGAQIINDTVTNASKAFTQAAVFASNPLTAALAPNAYIQGGIIIATGTAQLAKLVSPKGFATGGLIKDGVKIARKNGDDRLITAKDGEVVLNKDQQEALGGASIFKIIGVPGFSNGGVVGKASNFATVQNSFKIDPTSIQLSDEAIANIAHAIYSGSQSGISDLSENRRIAQEANF